MKRKFTTATRVFRLFANVLDLNDIQPKPVSNVVFPRSLSYLEKGQTEPTLEAQKKRLGLYFWQLGQVQCGHKSCVCAIAQQENRKNRWGLKCCCSRNQAAVLLQLAFLKAFLAKQQLLVYYTRELESKAIKRPYHAVLSRDTYPALSWNHTSPRYRTLRLSSILLDAPHSNCESLVP